MHQTRASITKKLPIPRKGTKYLARALRYHRNAVPVVIAVRDMLKLAHNAREVKHMIQRKILKINGRLVKDHREPVCLFNQLEAEKVYRLGLLKTGKFYFEELSKIENFLCKVTGKNLVRGGIIQLGLHDGSTLITKNSDIKPGDSLYLDKKGKIAEHISLTKGKEIFVISGKHQGNIGSASSIKGNYFDIKYFLQKIFSRN